MEPNICVKIPDKCFISPNPSEDFKFEFSFSATYGYLPNKKIQKIKMVVDAEKKKIKYPTITVTGFEKLLSDSEKIEEFISNLKQTGDPDWIIEKSANKNDIIIKYTGVELDEEFYFRASFKSFISDCKINDLVTMTVSVNNFDFVEDNQYEISTKVDYVPWAKSITFDRQQVEVNGQIEVNYEYMGDNVDKILTQNEKIVETARSPYKATIDKPTTFKLDVFNNSGQRNYTQKSIDVFPPEVKSFTANKSYFSKGDKITLQWNLYSYSNLQLDNINKETDKVGDTSATVYPVAVNNDKTVTYKLNAYGYKNGQPTSDSKGVVLTQTLWSNKGAVQGFFAGDVYNNLKYNNRIMEKGNVYYCYVHPTLYKSEDGMKWECKSKNNAASADFSSIATACYDNFIYAMGKEESRLYISKYDFRTDSWDYNAAYQNCNSDIGCFAFSQQTKKYAQVLQKGMMIVSEANNGRWNVGNAVIYAPENKTVKGGDYCFFKNAYYAVMLCDDNYIYVYDCSKNMQDVLFKKKADEKDQFVNFIQITNELYIVTAYKLINVRTKDYEDDFSPMNHIEDKRMWLGRSKDDCLMGIYPDKNLWIYD